MVLVMMMVMLVMAMIVFSVALIKNTIAKAAYRRMRLLGLTVLEG